MKKLFALSSLLFCVNAAETNIVAPTLLVGDRTFTNATIRKINPTTVIVRDEGGFGSMAITNLPEPYREKFMDTNELRLMAETNAAAKAKNLQQLKSAALARADAVKRKSEEGRKESIIVRVDKVQSDGFLGTVIIEHEIRAAPASRVDYLQSIGAASHAPPSQGRLIRVEKDEGQSVFVANGPRDATEGKEVIVRGWKIGPKQIDGHTVEEWNCLPSWLRR